VIKVYEEIYFPNSRAARIMTTPNYFLKKVILFEEYLIIPSRE
jgi:hypothetical protein